MFSVVNESIAVELLSGQIQNSSAGAHVSFEGRVRDHNEGKRVTSLEYECYEALATREGERIIEETRQRFDILDAVCAHRTGQLVIGDLAVWVGVAAAHREAAFQACRYIIDAVKARVPIWKREVYTDGSSEWVNCAQLEFREVPGKGMLDRQDSELDERYYRQQMKLPEIAAAGQERLRGSSVLVVGAGGLGSPALLYLARAGVGRLGIVDYDRVEVDNLHRQLLYIHADIGQEKAFLAAERLRAANPFIEVAAHGRRLDGRNVLDLIGPYDIILDCTDNQEAKLLLNDACYLSGKPLVQAAVYQWEGQIHVMLPDRRGQCLRCLWGDALSSFCQGACEDTGVVAVAPGVIGTLQAAEAIKLILGIESPLRDHVLLVDLMAGKTSQIKAVRRQDCLLCGQNALTLPGHLAGISRCSELDLETLTDQELEEYRIVDIREDDEREELMPSSILHVPLSSVNLASKQPFPDRFAFAPDTRLLLFCQKGIRSLRLAAALREQGFVQALSVAGGAAAVARRLS